jgi:AcrR family transcriptional regulator
MENVEMTTEVKTRSVPSEAAGRRQLILSAAHAILAEQGLGGLTIRAVLARTGLARRALYDLFGTKDDIVLAVFDEALANAAEQLTKDIRNLSDPAACLDFVIRTIVVGKGGHSDEMRVMNERRSAALSLEHLGLAQSRPADLQRAIEPLIGLLRGIIADGIAQGRWHNVSADRSARFIYNLVSTTVQTEMLDPRSALSPLRVREELADALSQFCARALAA